MLGKFPVETTGPGEGERDGAQGGGRRREPAGEKHPSPGRSEGEWQSNPEVEANDFAADQTNGQNRQQEHLMQSVSNRRLAGSDVRIPQRPFAGQQRSPQPEVTSPEMEAQITNVENTRIAETRQEWNRSNDNDKADPQEGERSSSRDDNVVNMRTRLIHSPLRVPSRLDTFKTDTTSIEDGPSGRHTCCRRPCSLGDPFGCSLRASNVR